MSKIRFLVTGDFHSDLTLIQKIKQQVQLDKLDLIVLTGDISEQENDFNQLLSIFKNKPIILSPGNHETKKKLQILKHNYNVKLLNEEPFLISNKLVFFAPYDLEVGAYCKSYKTVLTNLKKIHKLIEHIPIKILVSHLPPQGTQISSSSPFYPFIDGSLGLKKFLEQQTNIQKVFVGHIHEASGLEEKLNQTKIINVSQTFKIFDFNLTTHQIKEILPPTKKN